ncbi:hypothetical protein Tco_0472422 [Tanacetum coccineum]
MDKPNITMEEYIRLEEEKAHRRGKVYNWETATYGKIWDYEDVHDLGSVETEFLAIVFNDTLTSEAALSYEPTVNSLNNDEIDFRISFDDSDDEDCTMTKLMFSHTIKKLLAEAVKEKEELKTKLESFETSSKSLNTLLNSQLSANDKAGFRHNGAKESKVSETITNVSKVETSNSKTSNDKVEMPKIKTVRMSEPIIEEWESDSEDDEIVVKPKEVTKTVKPSFEKIESVNSKE